MGTMLVFTNAADDRHDEFNTWYDQVHLTEVLSLPEFVGATRHVLADAQMSPEGQAHRYLAIYEYAGEAEDAIAALRGATFQMSDAMASDAMVVLFDAHSPVGDVGLS